MAIFEDIRLCKSAEFDYFEEERRDINSLRIGEMYVAMLALRRKVDGFGAAAVPLKIIEINDEGIIYRHFKSKNTLAGVLLKFTVVPVNYVHPENLIIQDVKVDRGFIRDHNEGLDGSISGDGIEGEAEHTDQLQIPELVKV